MRAGVRAPGPGLWAYLVGTVWVGAHSGQRGVGVGGDGSRGSSCLLASNLGCLGDQTVPGRVGPSLSPAPPGRSQAGSRCPSTPWRREPPLAAGRPPPSAASPGTDRWKARLSLPALSQIFGDYYHFWHRAVTKRSLSPHHPRHSRLQREPQVSAPPAPLAATLPSLEPLE